MNVNNIVAEAEHARTIAEWAARAPVIPAGNPAWFQEATGNVAKTALGYATALLELAAAAEDLETQLQKIMAEES